MCPTITKSEAKELTKLGEKHGKTLSNHMKHPNGAKHSPKRIAPPKIQKQPMGMPLARLVLLKEEIYELSSDEDFSSIRIAKIGKLAIYFHFFILVMWEVTFKFFLLIMQFVGLAANPLVFKKPSLQKVTLDNGKGPTRKNKSDANLSFFSSAPLPQKGVPPLSKSKIEAKVRSIAENFTMESVFELPPPPFGVNITRLYIMLSETNIVMDRKLLEKSKDIMALLMKLETYGILVNLLISTFGQWYLYPLVNTLQLL